MALSTQRGPRLIESASQTPAALACQPVDDHDHDDNDEAESEAAQTKDLSEQLSSQVAFRCGLMRVIQPASNVSMHLLSLI